MGFEGETIISGRCPSGLCCQNDECEYMDDDNDTLCAANRDTTSLLCSECIEGYSESVNSAECIECEDRVYWRFPALSMVMAVVLTVFILFTNSEKDIVPKPDSAKVSSAKSGDDVAGNGRTVPSLQRSATLTELILENAKSESTKLMLSVY